MARLARVRAISVALLAEKQSQTLISCVINQLTGIFISPFAFSDDRARKRDVRLIADAAYLQGALFRLRNDFLLPSTGAK